MHRPNACKSISHKEIKAQEIIVSLNGIDTPFYYTRDGEIKIFKHSDELGGYTLLKKSVPYYADVVRAILSAK